MKSVKNVTVKTLREKFQQQIPLVMITAYDARQAQLVDEADVDMILVGDSVGMTTLGFKSTVYVTQEMIVHHTAAVARGCQRAMIVADMPFLSCDLDEISMMRFAGRLLQEAGAGAVKIEGGVDIAPRIRQLVRAGIPVVGHIGLLPQSVMVKGGYFVQGRDNESAEQLKRDALAVQEAGACAVVLECVPEELAKEITQMLAIPTIGIGAGRYCAGQVQVFHDILGLSSYTPKHAKKYVNLAEIIGENVSQYVSEVRNGTFFN